MLQNVERLAHGQKCGGMIPLCRPLQRTATTQQNVCTYQLLHPQLRVYVMYICKYNVYTYIPI